MHDDLIRIVLERTNHTQEEITQSCIDSLKRTCFLNYRETRNGPKGMKLSPQGFELFKTIFKSYEIDLPERITFTGRTVLAIERSTAFPYFLTKGKIHVFEENYALLLKLCDGDVLQVSDMTKPEI